MARIRNRRKPVAEMNVVPYIDVMLVLLVIFMVTAPMLNQGVKVDLPKVSTEVLPQDNNARVLTVSIKADRTYYWNMGEEVQTEQTRNSEAAVSLDKLVGAVRGILAENSRQGKKVQVYVRGDKAVDYGAVMAVMGGLQQAGVGNVGLITEAPDASRGTGVLFTVVLAGPRAVGLHAVLFGLLFVSFASTPDLPPARPVVQATLYEMKSKSQAESQTRQKIAGEAKKTAAREFEMEQLQQRKAEEQRIAAAKAEEQKRAEAARKAEAEKKAAEQKRQAEVARKKAEDEAKKKLPRRRPGKRPKRKRPARPPRRWPRRRPPRKRLPARRRKNSAPRHWLSCSRRIPNARPRWPMRSAKRRWATSTICCVCARPRAGAVRPPLVPT